VEKEMKRDEGWVEGSGGRDRSTRSLKEEGGGG